MECFNSLFLKLREVHEREVEGWQIKIQELSNKKGCDTKRMEELFTKNQQMKEQQRLLTENIKTLENRLRAGLCDRCTVTQEVAKRRQQEFEASQIQSIQHISLLVAEVNNLKKENKILRDEIRSSRAALEGHSDHSSNSSTTTEVKPNSSPDLSPCCGPAVVSPVALVTAATSMASNQPADGDVAVKIEATQRTEDVTESELKQWRGMNRSHFEPYNPPASTSWKTEHNVARVGTRRVQSAEGLDNLSSIPPQALLLKNSCLSTGRQVNPSRHVLHAPVPCRPQPIKNSAVSLQWPLSESSDWVTAPGNNLLVSSSLKQNLSRFAKQIPPGQQPSPRKQVFGSLWPKQGASKHPAKEPTVLFRLRSLSEHVESQAKPQEKKESLPSKAERVSGEGLSEECEGPLDLSDRGAKCKASQMPRHDSPSASQGIERIQNSPDKDVKTSPSVPSRSPAVPPSSSSTLPVKPQEAEPTSDQNNKQVTIEVEQKEKVNGQMDQIDGKKVPVLTLSLRPVVLLETLNSNLQKKESQSNSKSSSPAAETGSSSDQQDEGDSVSRQESNQGCKRKRTSVATETNRDSDTDDVQQERKRKITMRTEQKSHG